MNKTLLSHQAPLLPVLCSQAVRTRGPVCDLSPAVGISWTSDRGSKGEGTAWPEEEDSMFVMALTFLVTAGSR